jgi:hypothetical protein
MTKETKTDEKQTVKGKFPPGNKIGKQFPPGVSGNPNGRPKLTKLTESLREQLAEEMPGASESTIAEEVARALIREALIGNIGAIKEVFDRSEGRAPLTLDVGKNLNFAALLVTLNQNEK